MKNTSSFNLTPEEERLLREATPEQWAEAASTLAKDREFWKEIGVAVLVGFLEGFSRALSDM